MRQPHIDDFVRLTQDSPELALNKGEVGVVRSTWFAPSVAYEVEFHQIGHDYQTRCLLGEEQVQVEDGPLADTAGCLRIRGDADSVSDYVVGARLRGWVEGGNACRAWMQGMHAGRRSTSALPW